MVLSKPLARAVACAVSELGDWPARTRHEATSVAPFQLANTAVWSSVASTRALAAGGHDGCPDHWKRNAR